MVLIGIADGFDPGENQRYSWGYSKPRYRLSSILLSSIESLCIDNKFTSLSDNTQFLWDFIHDLAQLSLLRVFGCSFGFENLFTKLSAEFPKHGIEFKTEWP
jgi:hypothetical protein